MEEEKTEGEIWAEVKRESRERKASNEKKSLAILRDKKIEVIAQKGAGHYKVGPFDFWPSTGKFYDAKTGRKGRGVFNLIRHLTDDMRCSQCDQMIFNHFDIYDDLGLCGVCAFGTADALNDE